MENEKKCEHVKMQYLFNRQIFRCVICGYEQLATKEDIDFMNSFLTMDKTIQKINKILGIK